MGMYIIKSKILKIKDGILIAKVAACSSFLHIRTNGEDLEIFFTCDKRIQKTETWRFQAVKPNDEILPGYKYIGFRQYKNNDCMILFMDNRTYAMRNKPEGDK